jgi:DNA-binding NarL/FixJ family response regulator
MSVKVLIVDDDASFRKLLEIRIRAIFPECEFTIFESISPARDYLKQPGHQSFDLVVLDEFLPDGRGAEFLSEGLLRELAVLSMSSDDAPEIPGSAVSAGATYFLSKRSISDPLFPPLVKGVMERNRIQRELSAAKADAAVVEAVRTLVGTLKHEINNPLGAVLGAAYLFKASPDTTPQQREAASLVEESGKRIKHVLEQLSGTLKLEKVSKADVDVFQVPGDASWKK